MFGILFIGKNLQKEKSLRLKNVINKINIFFFRKFYFPFNENSDENQRKWGNI